MTSVELRQKYLKFFEDRGHKIIPSASLIPSETTELSGTQRVLFTTAGMHPLVPYLIGQPHPQGKRLTNVQRCLRTDDIDEVGDAVHNTFFEMLGNWSLGDYWKKEAIELTFEFHTKVLKIPTSHYAVSCFEGDKNASKDNESSKIWEGLGISNERISFLGRKDNWWGPAGDTGPCGPDTEQFYWSQKNAPPKRFDPTNKGWVEIGNDVLMQYVKDKRAILVDGMGCIYDEKFNSNKELLNEINKLNTHTILTVNGFREKGISLIKKNSPGFPRLASNF
ncbi:MAG: alanine--tRNA ligase-related protein [Candidatus Curtissbacteria bacterium]|nr:alanine--tRNA ligase-related protein [Candidatus Curtissbacteria bacterium]